MLTSPAAQGWFLSEQELATRIGVSRNPVREVLPMLQAQGLGGLRAARAPASHEMRPPVSVAVRVDVGDNVRGTVVQLMSMRFVLGRAPSDPQQCRLKRM
ncbi:GntR family transcriptional regulator [Rhodococcus opacus]|uniref:GntR family transcriptional regulator n=1 Tax=Rhodococcus opacus TaxID=37919 RepID=A0AAX3YG37_RHOOP|nr:GntR family transcriptional regulator [Rhodococcus opacus]MCZ4583419.1 GntR family transcriptional regulator [Rhodococcus opacus]WLF47146.1 GntR family transcriptional regulator [Rhodococcus opacus]